MIVGRVEIRSRGKAAVVCHSTSLLIVKRIGLSVTLLLVKTLLLWRRCSIALLRHSVSLLRCAITLLRLRTIDTPSLNRVEIAGLSLRVYPFSPDRKSVV